MKKIAKKISVREKKFSAFRLLFFMLFKQNRESGGHEK